MAAFEPKLNKTGASVQVGKASVGDQQFTIWFNDQLFQEPTVMSLFLRCNAELMDTALSNGRMPADINNLEVFYIKNSQDQAVAGIAYEYRANYREGWIHLSFTAPEFRGQGFNGMLHTYFENKIKAVGGRSISSYVNLDNASRLASAKKAGFEPLFYKMFKELK